MMVFGTPLALVRIRFLFVLISHFPDTFLKADNLRLFHTYFAKGYIKQNVLLNLNIIISKCVI
jgi:hypothetical protein